MGFPLCGRAGACFARNSREGSDGTPSRLRGRSFREICEGVARKALSDVVPCAGAHDRQTFPNGERGGQGAQAPKTGAHDRQTFPFGKPWGQGAKPPKPKRWRCGGRGERARARGLPQRHRSSSREAARSSANPDSASEDLGVSKGGRPAPHFGPGIRKGVKLPCACLCLLSAGAESRGPRAARARRREK